MHTDTLSAHSNRRVRFHRNLVGWPTPSVTPSVSFPSYLTLPCFARQAPGQGSCSQVDFGFGVTVPVEEIIVMQSGLGLCKVESLRDRGYSEVWRFYWAFSRRFCPWG